MSLNKDVMEALNLANGESIVKEWKCHKDHCVCVLTNKRIVLFGSHHALKHPHREASWSEFLKDVQVVDVLKTGDVTPNITHAFGPGWYSSFGPGGSMNTSEVATGDFHTHVDNVVVFSGGPDEAASIRDAIEKAVENLHHEQAGSK
jgi:hypothetical protein